jgi:hypothetical protein
VTASFAQQEIWHVMLASDDMKRMNVDQLDDAFRLDLVDASTLVWKTGMEGWRRLGSIAGIDDEPETISRTIEIEIPTRVFGPPAPPPPPRPRHQPRTVAPELNPFLSSAPVNPFASTTPAAVFTAPQLLAPAYSAPLYAPDPYVLPKRRVKVPSEVDFRRASGVRWGRWLVGFLLLTAGVLGTYRQDYLRQGAQRLGIENKYIHGERRVTGWVSAKAPPVVKAALTRAALLPGPNALPEAAPAKPLAVPAPAVAVAAAAAPSEPGQAPSATKSDSEVKTVSLDSLPVLTAEQAATPAAPAAAAAPVSRPRAEAKAAAEPKARPAAKVARQEADEAPAPKAKAEPKPEPKAPKAPPNQMNTPLKAAIWAAMQKDK